MSTRPCEWCTGPIPPGARSDAITCSQRCRQARARFARAVGYASRDTGAPLRLAYADPPYPGRSRKYYGEHPDFAGEVDHAALLSQLATYDGWALSTAADALQQVLALCPPGVRVAAWHRGARPNRRATRPLNAWEPVIYYGGRGAQVRVGYDPSRLPGVAEDLRDMSCRTVVQHDGRMRTDSLVHIARPRTTDPGRVVGAKSATFARWVFELLGATAHDELHDIFPGSGGIARAWNTYTREAGR